MPKKQLAELTNYDRIKAWMLEPEKSKALTPTDKEVLERWDFADTQLRRFPKKKMVAEMIRKKFKGSVSRAYLDIYNAQRLFGSVHPFQKEWWRNFLIEDILVLLEAARKRADLKAWNAAHANLIKAAGLEKVDEDKVDPEIISKHNFFTVIQIGNANFKIDLDTFHSLPLVTRDKIIKELDKEIGEDIAFEIMES